MNDSPIILRTAARWLLPLLLMFSLLLLLRGHHEPGGGFIAGLTAAGAFALYRTAYDARSLQQLLGVHPSTIIALGLLLVFVGAGATWLAGQPFLTAGWTTVSNLHLGTPLVFDTGIAVVVLGFALLILTTLAEEP